MRVFVYVLLAVATLCGYIFPIVLGVFVAPLAGETSLTFPQIGVLWAIAFGGLAGFGVVTPLICADRKGWLRL
ncbi:MULTISPECIES: hypothetical protein [Sphingomonas]|jgi:hypothetical protein|uniref:hypothetical protein n=1 Tax=Sphingomonas TaxID=13687 RepID=UPI001AE20C67